MSNKDTLLVSCKKVQRSLREGIDKLALYEQAQTKAHLLVCDVCAWKLMDLINDSLSDNEMYKIKNKPPLNLYDFYMKSNIVSIKNLSNKKYLWLIQWLKSNIIPHQIQLVKVFGNDMIVAEANLLEPKPGEESRIKLLMSTNIDSSGSLNIRVRITKEEYQNNCYILEVGVHGEEGPISLADIEIVQGTGEAVIPLDLPGIGEGHLPLESLFLLLKRIGSKQKPKE